MDREDKIAAAHGSVLVELPLGDAAPTFSLVKAVCSHGLFMMAPNHWDPHSKTLRRPLRLDLDDEETSLMVHISHPSHSIHALHLRVFGTRAISPQQQQSLLSQVRRMLRLSEEENERVIEFHKVHEEAKEMGFGRMFRSPTLFEDIIKCMLLCNCQWSRTLNMAQALCELQAELHNPSSNAMAESATNSSCLKTEINNFAPKTPMGKESKSRRKPGVRNKKCSKILANKYAESLAAVETETKIDNPEKLDLNPTLQSRDLKEACFEGCPGPTIGNFPSPTELAKLDEDFLARRCNLGYRARRVINFAREVVEGRFQLCELECACDTVSLFDYDKLNEKLRSIDGLGPYTCANVLMCMGYYHVVPSDSETIRHLKQVHAKRSTMQTVQGDIEEIYGKYAPFQFLAYWSEMWRFYEERFGKLSEVAHSSYRLITAANMKPKTVRSKKIKLSVVA
ncbi:hypothetical protein PHJA_001649600 [Phtheirospermum japonicum]|uniref:HhH-GPD domain-containing protein n=1 Tax=Phtheirospermum japonicum TaxID=374723 RepID=A0A830CA01_9LAMI|nr:hypothetical protein PHJA_001649600 [Phtheirospermum japonicum]